MERSRPISDRVARLYSGAWVAWNRDQTKILGSGGTFDDAKRAAAVAGEPSLVLGKIPSSKSWLHKSRRLIHLVAVFVALGPGTFIAAGPDATPFGQAINSADLDVTMDAAVSDDAPEE